MLFWLVLLSVDLKGQCGTGTSPIYTINFSAAKDTSWTLNASRDGTACVGTPGEDDRCIRFNVSLNSGSDLLNFNADQLTGASFYSINCGPLIPIGTPACITGLSSVCISFCKPGGNKVNYTITASSIIRGSEDLVLRQNCSGTMSVTGVSASTVNWRSIFPGAANAYNSYLSATSGVTSVTVTPTTGAPSFIDYEVSGTGACTGLRRDTIRVYTVSPMTVAINPATPAICNGASVTLNATVSGGNPPYVYTWNTGATTTGITVATVGNYSVSVADNTVGCPNEVGNVTVTAAATPAAPTVPPVTVCSGSPATITVSAPVGTHEWFTVASGGTAIATGNSYTTGALVSNTTYYVQTTNGGCTSSRTAVTVTVNPIPAAPTASGTTICAGQTASLSATGATGSSFEWFAVASGGTALSTASTFTTPALTTNTTYYVQALNGGCTGPRTAVTVTVNPTPANPTIAGASVCSGNGATLTATAPGGTYVWWDAATLGSSLGTGIAYSTGNLTSTTTYYVETTVNGCTSAGRTAVTVTVNPTPTAPTVNGASICGGNTASLSVTSTGDTYRWYNAASGGDLLTTGSNYTTPALNATTSYYISATSAAGCTGPRATATVNVTPIQNPAFVYSAGTYCTSGGVNPTPTIPGGNTGTFTSSAGLVFMNTSTGQIDVAASTEGLYTITFTTSGSCVYSSSVDIRIITGSANASFTYSTPFCVQQANPLPIFTGSASAGTFSSTAGLVFKNSNSGEIDLAASIPGNYTITNSIAPTGGCAGDARTFDIVINPNTTANAGINLVTCDAQPVTLNGSVGGSATSGSWSVLSGSGSFGNASQLSTSFTPTAGQTSVTLQLTSNNPVAPCAVATDIMVLNINPAPVAPTVNAVTVCSGNTATLIASAPGGTYNWYDVSTGGTPLQTGPTYTTASLTSTTTYYVAATSSDNCVGPRATVSVNVNALPEVTSASTGTVCSNVAQNYAFTSSIPGSSFTWSRAAVTNITNAVVSGQAGTGITEALESIVTSAVPVVYQIVPTANGCTGAPFNYTVTVRPIPATPTATTTGPVCEGGTIQLSSPFVSGASYSWSGPSFSSALREPQITNAGTANQGNYSVSITVDGCVSAAGTVAQTIKSTPAAPVLSSSSPVCIGQTISLNTPIVIGASYNWTGPGGYASVEQNPSISNAQSTHAGTYSLSLTVNGCAGPSASTNVVVNSPPSAVNINSNGPVCITESLTLTADELAAASYLWSGPSSFSASSRIVTINSMTNATAGIYQVVASVAGCASIASSIDATLKPTPAAPVIDPVAPVCENGTLVLNAADVSGATYNWTGPNGFSNTARNPSINNVTVSMAGTYTAYLTVNGCRSANNTVSVVVNSLPAAPALSTGGPVCVGNTLQLNAATVTGASYNWTGPGGFVSTAQNPSISNVAMANAGVYNAFIQVNGCSGPTATVNAVINPLPGPVNISSSGPVCVSEPLTVSADLVASASYAWTGPNGFTSSDREFIIPSMSSATAGTYQLIVSVAGCSGSPNLLNTSLKPTPAAPAIDPVSPVCENGTFLLNAADVSGATYSWTGPNGFTNTTRNPSVNNVAVSMAGTYAVNIVVNGCRSANNTVNVVVNPLPAAPSLSTGGPVCAGSTLQLNAATVTGASYNWTGPDGFTATAQNPTVLNTTVANAGVYTAFVRVNGCAGPSSTINAVVNPIPGPVNINSSGPVCVAEPLSVSADVVPAASYSWTGPNGFTASAREFVIPSMSSATAGTYQLIVAVAGCSGSPNLINTSLKPTPSAPAIDPVSPVCENGTLVLNAALVTGATYQWSGPLGFVSNTQSPAITAVTTNMSGNYAVNIVVNGCRSASNTVNVVVNPLPSAPALTTGGAVCVGNTLQLNAATVAGASYSWTGPNGFVSAVQNPSLANATLANAGMYTAVIRVNNCAGPAATINAVVNPLPGPVNINSSGAVCEGRPLQLTADSVTAGVYSWTGPNGFTASTRSIAFASMNNQTAGVYQVAVAVAGCPGTANTINAVLKPTPAAPVINTVAPVCENGSLQLRLNTVAGAIYNWTGPLGFTSTAQNPFFDSVQLNRSGIYTAYISVDGCVSNNSSVNIVVVPEPDAPLISSNSPVCINNPLQFSSNNIAGASYRWIGVNGFTATVPQPLISQVRMSDTGRYGMAVTVNGCVSDTSYLQVHVDIPAVVNAGNNQVVCANNALVTLAGTISGGTATGIWSSSGSGRFGTRLGSLNNSYLPANQDTAAGAVQLTLTSTNNGACPAVSSSILVQITDAPFVDVGNNRVICANDSLLTLTAQFRNATGVQWSATGTGSFTSANAPGSSYLLSGRDQTLNSFRIIATTTGNGNCLAVSDELTVNLAPVPVVNAGKDVLVFENTPYTLNPVITGTVQSFRWTPANFLNDPTLRNPVFRGNADQALSVQVTSSNGCVASDEILITVLKPFPIPNVFSPNGDGVHDTWVIPELNKYPDAEVSVFDRTGRRVFFTSGYKTPWDGRYEGKPLPVATYYYIIIPKLIQGVFSGPVTILK